MSEIAAKGSTELQQLLPAAPLSSPIGKLDGLKTPPSKLSLLTSKRSTGLLSPDFSSPNNQQIEEDDEEDEKEEDNKSTRSSSSDKESAAKSGDSSLKQLSKKRSNESSTDLSSNKKFKSNEPPVDFVLPDPGDMPVVTFTSSTKPPFSYANMIGMALLRAPMRRLTLAEIYDWIADHFSYYERGQVGWQNSIRHNLSLNKAFEKTEKSKDKKGHFWQIVSGCEYAFFNIKESKRSANSNSRKLKAPSSFGKRNGNDDDEFDNDELISTAGTVVDSSSVEVIPNLSLVPSTPISKFSSQFDDSPLISKFDFKTPILNHLNNNNNLSINDNHQFSSIISNNISLLQSSPLLFESPISNLNSANSRKIDFTCSFSSSNFEMSPMAPISEPGPILEPITPQRSSNQQKVQLPSISKQLQSLQPISTSSNTKIHDRFKTPVFGASTPITSSIKRAWASPSYLEEFLVSPLPNIKSHPNHHHHHHILSHSHQMSIESKLFSGSPVTKLKRMSNSGYSTNEIFGIDICSINNMDDDIPHWKK